jgi:hypothetical protein
MENKTAVSWLVERFFASDQPLNNDHITQALAMERQQIINAHKDSAMFEMDVDIYAEKYYTETYGK